MAALAPYGIFFQAEGNGHRILARKGLYGNRKLHCFSESGSTEISIGTSFSFFPSFRELPRSQTHRYSQTGSYFYNCFVFLYIHSNVLIAEFYFLHLRGSIALAAVYNTISAEIVIAWMIIKVSAVRLELFSVAVFL